MPRSLRSNTFRVGVWAGVLALTLCASIATAQDGTWSIVTPGGPSPRHQHGAIYDPIGDRMIVFGGAETIDETWALSLGGTPAWTNLAPGSRPSGRKAMATVYDPVRRRFLIFGGYAGSDYTNEVWALPLEGDPEWVLLAPAGTRPSNRMFTLAIYDPLRDRIVVFGGHPTELNDVWELTLSGTPNWNQIFPGGEPPSPRYGHAGIYDPIGDRLIVFGGTTGSNQTWALTLSGIPTWNRIASSGTVPPGRVYPTAVYDEANARMVLHGGASQNDTWALSLIGTPTWSRLLPDGPVASTRVLHTAIYQSTAGRMVVFGGSGNGAEVAILSWNDPRLPTTLEASTSPNPSACGEEVTLSLTVQPATATGLVVVTVNGSVVGNVTLADGSASLPLSGLIAGPNTIGTSYEGDAGHRPSVAGSITQNVGVGPTSLTLVSSENPSVFGMPITLTATCSDSTATGTVQYFLGPSTTPFSSAPLLGGTAATTVTTLPAGAHTIIAKYPGAGCHGPSSDSLHQVIMPIETAVSILATPNPSAHAQSITVSVAIAPVTATGTVDILDGPTLVATLPLVGGAATLQTSGLAVGDHPLTAAYPGDSNHVAATSPVHVQAVLARNPSIVSVRDVPADQGGRVYLAWRCPIDRPGINIVTGYRVWRGLPLFADAIAAGLQTSESAGALIMRHPIVRPDGSVEEFFWEAIALLPADHLVNYAYTAPTTVDSIPGAPQYTPFLVTALTADPFVSYPSAPDSGYSIDNLEPEAPEGFGGGYAVNTVSMQWAPNTEADLAGYRIHRAPAPDFVPDASNLVATVTGTNFEEVIEEAVFYKLAAIDAHGNASAYVRFDLVSMLDGTTPVRRVFGLAAISPNPARGGSVRARFDLPDEKPATLEVFDVLGRRVVHHEVGSLGAGSHQLRLGDGTLRPGVYRVLLRQADHVQSRRFTVLN